MILPFVSKKKYLEALEEIEKLKAGKIPERWRNKAEFIYERDGRQYYSFSDLTDMGIQRHRELENKLILFGLGISEEWFKEGLKKASTAHFQTSNKKDVSKFLTDLEERVHFKFNSDSLLEIAAIIVLRDDESHITLDKAIMRDKIRTWQSDPELYDFFLTYAWVRQKTLSGDLEASLQKSLAELQEKLKQEKELFGRTSTTLEEGTSKR